MPQCAPAARASQAWMQAADLSADMHTLHITPDVITYNCLIHAYRTSGHWATRETGKLITRMWQYQVTPNRVTYNSNISACRNSQAGPIIQISVRAEILKTGPTQSVFVKAWKNFASLQISLHSIPFLVFWRGASNGNKYKRFLQGCQVIVFMPMCGHIMPRSVQSQSVTQAEFHYLQCIDQCV